MLVLRGRAAAFLTKALLRGLAFAPPEAAAATCRSMLMMVMRRRVVGAKRGQDDDVDERGLVLLVLLGLLGIM